ncbi:MAG TPA: hypothetical protein PLT94_14545 [Rhodocyclaceae bacterium]|nr:hypothetical protein [Rhodocyclaceae bacterium]
MKVDLPEEVEKHKLTAWIRAHRSASRIIAAIVLTLVVVGACAIARAAPLTIDCAGAWSLSGSTVSCAPAGQPQPPNPQPPIPPTPPGCSIVDAKGEVSVSFPGSVAVRFTALAAGTGTKKIETSPHGGGGSFDVAISATPCSYAAPVRFVTSSGRLGIGDAATFGSNGFVTLYYKAGVNVDAGGTYYLNARSASGGGLIIKMP